MMNNIMQAEQQIKRALCDSDFDGCVCAAIIKEVFPDVELFFTDPGSVQCGKYDEWVSEDTIIADLPYVKGTGLYFDHHLGNKPTEEIQGRWAPTNSAAEVLFKEYEQRLPVGKYEKLIERLGHFDSGKVVIEDVKNPDIYMRMGFAIDRKDNDFHKFFAEFLAQHDWDQLINQERVQQKLANAENEREKYLEFMKENTKLEKGIIFLDMRGYEGNGGHSFFVTLQHPESRGVVVIKEDCNCRKLQFFQNTFNKSQGEGIDFLKIAKAINPIESGGHKGACGCTLPKDMSIETAIELIKQQL